LGATSGAARFEIMNGARTVKTVAEIPVDL
jgi:hypothetical protein